MLLMHVLIGAFAELYERYKTDESNGESANSEFEAALAAEAAASNNTTSASEKPETEESGIFS